jgi:nucleoside phosphorylase
MSFFINSLIRAFLTQEAYRFVEREITTQINQEWHARQEASEQAASIHTGHSHVDFAIIFSQHHEAVGLLDRHPDATVTHGNGNTFSMFIQNGKRVVAAIPVSYSRECFEHVANVVLDVFPPRRIITAGFAVGITPAATLFSLYVPDLLIDAVTRQTINLRQLLLPASQTDEPSADRITSETTTNQSTENLSVNEKATAHESWFHTATLVTVKRLALTVLQKKEIRSEFAAQIADYSAFPVASICRKRLVPILPLRIVTSVYDEEIPCETKPFSGKTHHARRIGTFLGNVMRRPGCVIDVLKQKQRQLEAADILATKMIQMIQHSCFSD